MKQSSISLTLASFDTPSCGIHQESHPSETVNASTTTDSFLEMSKFRHSTSECAYDVNIVRESSSNVGGVIQVI